MKKWKFRENDESLVRKLYLTYFLLFLVIYKKKLNFRKSAKKRVIRNKQLEISTEEYDADLPCSSLCNEREKEADYMKTITALKRQNKSLKVMLQTAKRRRNNAI